jgi:putative hemolysin
VVPAIDIFAKICRPLIWLIGKNTNGIVRLLGFDPDETESEVSDEELRVLVNSNTRLSKDERTILDDVFDASETIVAEVMRPRADVVFLDGNQSLEDAAAYVREMPYSRYPVTGKDFDEVLGFVHVRDLLDVRDPNATTVADVTREGISLPGTSKLLPSLELLRKRGIHLAVVIDEYGGTDGIATLEDMTEELVGDIRDEYDLPEEKGGERRESQAAFVNGVATIDGGMTIEDFADVTGIELEDGPYETVAGYFLAHTGKMGTVGEVLHSDDGYDMVVTEVDNRRIETLEVRKSAQNETTTITQ